MLRVANKFSVITQNKTELNGTLKLKTTNGNVNQYVIEISNDNDTDTENDFVVLSDYLNEFLNDDVKITIVSKEEY